MKVLIRILIGLAILLIVGGVAIVMMLDSIAAETIERGGTYALGVETTVDAVDIDLGGELHAGLSGLEIANPPGFESPRFFALGAGGLEFPLGSIMSDSVEVPEILLEGIEINLERSGGNTNYGVILDSLARFESGETEQAEGEEGGKVFVVRRIVLRDISSTIDLIPIGGDSTRVSFQIPEIVIEDLGNETSTADLFGIVIKTLLTAVLNNAGGLLPADMLEDLNGHLNRLGSVGFELTEGVVQSAEKLLGEGQEKLGELGEKAGEALEGVGKEVEDAAGEALKELGGLFKKKDG